MRAGTENRKKDRTEKKNTLIRFETETRHIYLSWVLLILGIPAVRFVDYHFVIRLSGWWGTIFLLIILDTWFFQTQRRLIHPLQRRYLGWDALLLVFLVVIRILRYDFLAAETGLRLWIWYCYYVPLIWSMVLLLLAVCQIGTPVSKTASDRNLWLLIPSSILSLGVLTNDLHYLAFSPDPVSGWDHYRYGPLYYLLIGYIMFLAAAVLLVSLKRCMVTRYRRQIWKPMLPIFAMGFYFILNLLLKDHDTLLLIKTPEMICIINVLFAEGLIQANLFPVNERYYEFLEISSLGGGFTDSEGNLLHSSENSPPVTPEQVIQAADSPVLLSEKKQLQSRKIQGGYGYWIEDLSQIRSINQKLEELGDVIAEENALLEVENQIAEEQTQLAEQELLYEEIEKSVKDSLSILEKTLEDAGKAGTDEETFVKQMRYACIINAYIKRHSNLLLLNHQNKMITAGELVLSIKESLDYVRESGVETKLSCDRSDNLFFPGEVLLFYYEWLEYLIELGIPGMERIGISLMTVEKETASGDRRQRENGNLVMEIRCTGPCGSPSQNWKKVDRERLNIGLRIWEESGTKCSELVCRSGL